VRIKLEEDLSRALPKDKNFEKFDRLLNNSRLLDKMAVAVSLRDTSLGAEPDSLIAFADSFAAVAGEKLSRYISRISYNMDDESLVAMLDNITDRLPVYLEERDYQRLDSSLRRSKLPGRWSRTFHLVSSPAGIAMKKIITKDPLGLSHVALKKLQNLQFDENLDIYNNHYPHEGP
jgi:hypothetical protein